MKKFRTSLLILVLSLGVALMVAPAAGAYTFTYYGSGFFSQSEVPNVSDGSNWASDGPRSVWHTSYASSDASAYLDNVGADVSGYGKWSAKGNLLGVEVTGNASGYSNVPEGSGSAYGGTVTSTLGVTTGIFFQITGGGAGDQVTVHYLWNASASTGAGGTATLGGGFDTPMYISVNGDRLWFHEEIFLDNDDYQAFLVPGAFMAQVGDIIGINLAAGANLDFSGEGGFESAAYNSMQLDVVPLPPSAWLLGSGLLGLLALRGFRPRRR